MFYAAVPSANNDDQRHLMGTSLFIRAAKPSHQSAPSRLREAVFWIYLRQEIAAAFAKQRSLLVDLDGPIFQSSIGNTEDVAWSDRIILLSAQALQWAFGKNAPFDEWARLHEAIAQWEQERPESFEAIFYQPEDPAVARWFPNIWFSDDEHGKHPSAYTICIL